MATDGAAAARPGLIPAKRSLFNKPAWSNPQVAQNAGDLFERSKSVYTDMVQEREDRRKRRLARSRKEQPRDGNDNSGREGKRRRISGEDDDRGAEDEATLQVKIDPEGVKMENRYLVRSQ